jgi:hypothetical protein
MSRPFSWECMSCPPRRWSYNRFSQLRWYFPWYWGASAATSWSRWSWCWWTRWGGRGHGDSHRSDSATAAAASAGVTATFAESVTVLGNDDVADAVHPSTPNGFVASMTVAEYDSPDEFCWEGDMVSVSQLLWITLTSPFLVCYVASHSTALPSFQVSSTLQTLLHHPSIECFSAVISSPASLIVADSGATDHMLPDQSAFISYRHVHGLRVWMGNATFAPVLGRGTAILSLNGKSILVRNVLHIPDLHVPLYSLRAHLTQPGCG